MNPLTLATLQREAQSGARRLARSLNLCRDAEADISQDLLVDLFEDKDRGRAHPGHAPGEKAGQERLQHYGILS